MKFGNSSPCRHSWWCSSLWRQVALSSGEDPCCGWEGVSDSPRREYQHSSFHTSHRLSWWRLPLHLNQQQVQDEDSRKGQPGAHKDRCGGRNSPAGIFGAWWEDTEASTSIPPWRVSSPEPPTAVRVSRWCKNGLLCHRLEISSRKFQAGGCQFGF